MCLQYIRWYRINPLYYLSKKYAETKDLAHTHKEISNVKSQSNIPKIIKKMKLTKEEKQK